MFCGFKFTWLNFLGKIVSIETFDIKYKSMFEPKEIDPDASTWEQNGCTARFYLSVIRIFYMVGPPEPITAIGRSYVFYFFGFMDFL